MWPMKESRQRSQDRDRAENGPTRHHRGDRRRQPCSARSTVQSGVRRRRGSPERTDEAQGGSPSRRSVCECSRSCGVAPRREAYGRPAWGTVSSRAGDDSELQAEVGSDSVGVESRRREVDASVVKDFENGLTRRWRTGVRQRGSSACRRSTRNGWSSTRQAVRHAIAPTLGPRCPCSIRGLRPATAPTHGPPRLRPSLWRRGPER